MSCKTILKYCLISALSTVGSLLWIDQAYVFTVFNQSNTWNEAHEICHNNNNSLLSMKEEVIWKLWQELLDPTINLPQRDIERFWFGLHAPDPSNLEHLFWDDCSEADYIEWETTAPRPTYVVNYQCVAFDVYFKPFTTVLLQFWIAEQCNKRQSFVCSYTTDVTECMGHHCEELVYFLEDENVCSSLTTKLPGSDYRVLNVSNQLFCHLYQHNEQYTNIYNICYLPDTNITLTYCSTEINWVDTFSADDSLTPDDQCKPLDDVTTTVTESSTQHQTAESLCECPCKSDTDTVTSMMTLEQKMEQRKKELTINKKNTSLHKRRFISVHDSRASAAGIGSLGVAVLVLVVGSIVLMDITSLKKDMFNIMHNIRFLYGKHSVSYRRKKDEDIPNEMRNNKPGSDANYVKKNVNNPKSSIQMCKMNGSKENKIIKLHHRNTLQEEISGSKSSGALQKNNNSNVTLIRTRVGDGTFVNPGSEVNDSLDNAKLRHHGRERPQHNSTRHQPNVKVIKCVSEDSHIRWMQMF